MIVGNLEGIIAKKKSGWASQNHRGDIFKDLKELTKNLNIDWLLCMSNNHSGDFGYCKFKHTWDLAIENEIEIFGPRKRPCFPDGAYLNQKNDKFSEFLSKINIVSGTMWRNHSKTCNYISLYEWKNSYFNEKKFNILYPHWHYENEDYVREGIQENCSELMKYGDDSYEKKPWDLVFGHHPHVPQAITNIESESDEIPNKLLAYSGGNFTSGVWRDKHNHGLIMKCEIGTWIKDANRLAVGEVQWSYIRNKFNRWKFWRKNRTKEIIIDIEQNNKKSYFIIRKRILYGVYISLLIALILAVILLFFNFQIDIGRIFINLGVFQIIFLVYIAIMFKRRRYRKINNNIGLKKEVFSNSSLPSSARNIE